MWGWDFHQRLWGLPCEMEAKPSSLGAPPRPPPSDGSCGAWGTERLAPEARAEGHSVLQAHRQPVPLQVLG